jgi:magnesium transporter
MSNSQEETSRDDTLSLISLLIEVGGDEFREKFIQMHPTDQMNFLLELDENQRKLLYPTINPIEMGEIFQGLSDKDQLKIIEELDFEFAVSMLNNMYTDDTVDFLEQLEPEKAELFFARMDAKYVIELRKIMDFPEDTAGALMTTEFIEVKIKDTVTDAIKKIRAKGSMTETLNYLYVVDRIRGLVGVLSIKDLLFANPDDLIETIMTTNIISVKSDEDQEKVARVVRDYDFTAVPVVSSMNKLLGIITVDDIIDVIEEEITEDFGEFSAVKVIDFEMGPLATARKRAPWIMLLMFLGMIAAQIIGLFEATLEQLVILAVFIPMIMGSAGNTGTQALAVVVRSLAIRKIEKKDILKLLWREFVTGLIIGVLCCLTLLIVITLIYGNLLLAFIVGFALIIGLSLATVVGTVIPLIVFKLKIDPAVASGPFITTTNDIIALMIYFSVATYLIEYLI